MVKDRRWGRLVGLAVVAAFVLPAFAGGTSDDEQAGKVAQLRALLESQQQKMASLEQQVTAAAAQDEGAVRADVMREQIRQILSEQEFRESLMPSMLHAGYDNGFFIRSSDDKFLLKVDGLVRFRWTHYDTRARNHYTSPRLERNDRTGFDVSQLRFGISGHAYTEDLTYRIRLRAEAADTYDAVLYYAYLNYKFCDALQFQAGAFKIAGTRAQMMSVGNLQFVDRPMTDAAFSLGRGLGVRFWGRLFDKRVDWYLDVVNALGTPANRTITTDPPEMDNNPALVFHAIWHALGDEPGDLMKSQSDVKFHENPAMDVGLHYAFNEDEGDTGTLLVPFRRASVMPGAYGRTTTNGMQVHQLGIDAAAQYQGFSATAEYVWRFLDPRRAGRTPFTPYWQLTGDGDDSFYHGGYLQLGYFLPIPGYEKKIEAVARVGGVGGIGPGNEGSWEYAAGLNYFVHGNKVKLQTDVTKIYEAPVTGNAYSIANVNDDALIFRVQLQVGF